MGVQTGSHVRVPLHSNVTIECPSPSFMTWVYQPDRMAYFNDIKTKPGDLPLSVYQNDSKLIFPDFNRNMSGFYYCQKFFQKDIEILVTPGN